MVLQWIFPSSLEVLPAEAPPCFCELFHVSRYSHGKDVQAVTCYSDHFEIVLQDGDGARESLMAAAAEERHTGIQQDGGDEGGVGNPTQAFNTALRAAWSKKKKTTEEYIRRL